VLGQKGLGDRKEGKPVLGPHEAVPLVAEARLAL
jgi:hypothetical protein